MLLEPFVLIHIVLIFHVLFNLVYSIDLRLKVCAKSVCEAANMMLGARCGFCKEFGRPKHSI